MSTSDLPHIRPLTNPSPKRLIPRPPLADSEFGGLPYSGRRKPTITTRVFACPDQAELDELDRIHPFPPGVITVQKNVVLDVVEAGTDSRPDSIVSDEKQRKGSRSGSEEEWFEKC
jgi:hypothetical protein